ncbi:hypothetical protein [Micromonospora sp. NPDC050276]|uniref:hypothetical protein n=1 Tax=Micromonospora sp. NPDC050276 TaxID=3364278 RepID=UPI0037B4F7EC
MLTRAVRQGLAAGLAGAVVMTAAEKVEQRVTGRPDSYVPARVLARLTGLPESSGQQPRWQNLAMHYGQGALVGVLRSVMAQAGLRGAWASTMFTALRLTNDQILENAIARCTSSSTRSPPERWPTRSPLVTARARGSGTRRCAPVATQMSVHCPGRQ